MTLNDVVNFMQAEYKQSEHVPSVKQLISKKVVKNSEEFYKYFSHGIGEACAAAGVPVPTERIARVRNALKHRPSRNPPQPIQRETDVKPQAVENIKPETVTPAPDPLLQQALDKESELANTRSKLQYLQRLAAADAANKRETSMLKHLEAVRNFRSSFKCSEHGFILTHWSGPIFNCIAGHIVMYNCPVCRNPLTYDETGFSCPATY